MIEQQHTPASERTMRNYLAGYPEWLIDGCIAWVRDRESRGHRFTGGQAAVQNWVNENGNLVTDGSKGTYSIPTADGAAVDVEVPGGVADVIWRCRGCGHRGHEFRDLLALVQAGRHAAQCGRGAIVDNVEKQLTSVRAELTRVDSKAGTLLAVAGVAASAVLAVLGRTGLPTAAAVTGWLAFTLLAAGVVLLALAILPRLDGNHGFVVYATADTGAELLAALTDRPPAAVAEEVIWAARAARAKYRQVRRAITLLLSGLAVTTATALLALVLA